MADYEIVARRNLNGSRWGIVPALSHSAHAGGTVATGANTPPYIIVRMWKRTA